MSETAYYITTAIDYVNAAPHLGHAYEKIATDVIARFQRMRGKNVFFLTGTDEHGAKVEKTARERGISPEQHTDEMVREFQSAWEYLNLRYDRFIRTTEPAHHAVVKTIWRKLAENGDIEKRSYTGLYCTGCEKFVTARDLDDAGECPHHHRKPETVEEENYFFRLSRYKDALKAHMDAHPNFVLPEFRAGEVRQMLEELEDISVSRHRNSVDWGIPVPDDDEQVVYVWIDALSNYLTGVDYGRDEAQFARYWPADVHMIGKDILRFHAVYWPAMLMSAGLPLPRQIFAHGFINLNDAKISKSTGNVVSPFTLRDRFELPNPDPIRYYLMTVAAFGQDGSFTEEDFKQKVNADLANNLGNLLNRTLNMTHKYFEGRVPAATPEPSSNTDTFREVAQAYEAFDFQKATALILQSVDDCNRQINDREPWTLYKEGRLDELAQLLYFVLETLRQVAVMLSPITPALSQDIWSQLGYDAPLEQTIETLSQQTGADADPWRVLLERHPLSSGQALRLSGPLLPRLDSELAGSAKKAAPNRV